MKKSKIGVFAVLGVLSLSAIAVGVGITSGVTPLTHYYDATENCAIKWDSGAKFATRNGKEEAVVQHVRTVYSGRKATTPSDMHARFSKGGYMATSNEKYGSVTPGVGGLVNGLTSITVNFTAPSGKVTDPEGYEVGTYAFELHLIASFNGQQISDQVISSGTPVPFTTVHPNEFKLLVKIDEKLSSQGWGYEYSNGTYVDIKDVSIVCSMKEYYNVAVTGSAEDLANLEWFYDDAHDATDDPLVAKTTADILSYQFEGNETVGVRTNKDALAYFDETGITAKYDDLTSVKNITKVPGTDGNHDKFEFVVDGNLTVAIDATLQVPVYEGQAFVGKYSGYAYNSKTTPVAFELNKFGRFVYGSVDLPYSVAADGTITIGDGTLYKAEVIGNAVYLKDVKGFKEYLAIKGETVTVTGHRSGPSATIYKLNDGVTDTLLAFVSGHIFVDGINGVTIDVLGGDVDTATGYRINAVATEGSSALTRIKNSSIYQTVAGDVTTDHLRFKVEYNKPTEWKKGVEAGTYTGPLGEVVLDGFDLGTIAGGEALPYVYDKTLKTVEIGEKILLIGEGNTYTIKKVLTIDPFITEPKSYTHAKYSTKLTFDNGQVTIQSTYDRFGPKQTKNYTFSNGIITFNADAYDEYGGDLVPFKLEVTDIEGLTTLKVVEAVKVPYGGPTLFAANEIFNLDTSASEVAPFTYGTYTGGGIKITIDDAQVSASGSWVADSSKFTYTYDDATKTITTKIAFSEYGTGEGELTVKFIVVDASTIKVEKAVIYQFISDFTGEPDERVFIPAGTVFTII